MKISSQSRFDGDPATVYDLLTDTAFLEAVCVASHAISHDVAVEPGSDGAVTTTTQELESPSVAATFVGSTITVVQRIAWGAPAADGSRVGQVTMSVPKQPVQMNGTLTLTPAGPETTGELTGELKVSIPLLGKKLEAASEPAILAGFEKQEEVARDWLPRR